MAAAAQYANVPRIGAAILTTGDASHTTPVTYQSVISAGSNGTRIASVALQGLGPTMPSVVRLFLWNGTTLNEWQEIAVAANAASTGGTAFSATFSQVNAGSWLPLVLPPGWSIRATINDTQPSSGVSVIIAGGDL
jgi:hypothetical protein